MVLILGRGSLLLPKEATPQFPVSASLKLTEWLPVTIEDLTVRISNLTIIIVSNCFCNQCIN